MIKYNFTKDGRVNVTTNSISITADEINFKDVKAFLEVDKIDFEISDRPEVSLDITDLADLPLVKKYLTNTRLDANSMDNLLLQLIREEVLSDTSGYYYLSIPNTRFALRLSSGLTAYESVMEYLYK